MSMNGYLSRLVKSAKVDWQYGPMAALFTLFQGRATFFASVFTLAGIILAFKGKLDANYSLFVASIQALIFAHSCKEDWFSLKNKDQDKSKDKEQQ